MTPLLQNVLALVGAYLVGAIPFGLLVARSRGIDIRRAGSGNIGATNVFRCVGRRWGILVFVCDFLKGMLPTLLLPITLGAAGWSHLGLLCGLAAVAGHNWPVYIGFKGGKGVATTTGVLLAVSPVAMGIALCVWILVFKMSRYVSLASMVAAIAAAGAAWWLHPASPPLVPAVLTMLAAFVLWRHRSNIVRLRNGTEHRFSSRKAGRPPTE
jgi:glycerol-3-phosphate acyltransferase PlsY